MVPDCTNTARCYKPILLNILLGFGLLLSGCTTLGPDYQEPEIEWITKWQPGLYGVSSTAESRSALDLRFWWRVFDDPVLNRLIEITQQQNIDLRIAGLRILESRAQLGIASSNLYPQTQQLSGDVIAAESRRRGGDLPNKNQSLVNYQTGFSLGWELDFWGKFKRGIESADASFFNSIANQQNIQVLLSAQVASLYYSYRTVEERIRIAKESAEIQKRSFEITQKLYASGQQSELDLQQAKTQYLGTLSTIPQLEIALIQTRNAMATLLARPPGAIPELIGLNRPLPKLANNVLQDIPENFLLRRPDVRAAAWSVAEQSARIGVAEADYYPSISLLGSISWSGSSVNSTPDQGLAGIGPGFRWNLFDHGRIENNIRVQDSRLQQLIEQYRSVVLSAAREVDDAAIGIVKTLEQMRLLTRSVKASKRALELANTNYREGYSGFQRVLDAQTALFVQAEKDVVNRGNHISSMINLYKGLGGGWLNTPINKVVPDNVRSSLEQRVDWGDLINTELPLQADEMPSIPGTINNGS